VLADRNTTVTANRASETHHTNGQLNPVGRLGWQVWRTLTSVRFAVLQISILAIAGVFGTVLRQVPAFALHDPQAYAQQMASIHAAYDPVTIMGANIGPPLVDLLEHLGLFTVFSAPWFVFLLTLLAASIVVCTLDRLPDLWRQARRIRLVQPGPFYDPRLPGRASVAADDESFDQLAAVLRHKRYGVTVTKVAGSDGQPSERHLYADKNRYMKLATLFTHLGLILFLAGAAVTTALGFETVLFLGEGDSAPVQAVGTPDNLLVKNIHFEAPLRPDGSFADFRTDLAIYQNGEQVARKVIRVNDPLEFDGYVFHQNTFGPAEVVTVHDAGGQLLWSGPVLLTDQLAGWPEGFMTVPGSGVGLLLVLEQASDGTPLLAVTGIGATPGPDGSSILFIQAMDLGETTAPSASAGYSVTWDQASAYTGMVVKRDPGQGLIWIAYLSLISGLILSFYFPRRRVWARLRGDRLELALIADRYVNSEREFGALLDQLPVRLRNRPEHGLQPSQRSDRT
jgi:cytochrome c biogenesis protein